MKTASALLLCTLLAAPALGQAQWEPNQIVPGTYSIDTKETLVRYGTIHMGFTEFWGTFPGATGTLEIDPKNISAATLEVKVPISLVETTNRELNHELFSDEFFDAEKYPNMKFVSTKVERTGPKSAKVTGNLSMHGVTKPVTLDVTLIGAGPNAFSKVPTIGFKAIGMVKRSDFGIAKYVPLVSDETSITISAAFEKR
jgi:polyisoprenoid-binding protein YceI